MRNRVPTAMRRTAMAWELVSGGDFISSCPPVDRVPGSSAQFRRQGDESTKSRSLRPGRARCQAQSRQSLYGTQQGNLPFESRDAHAGAGVRPGGECKMAIGLAGDIEALGIGELVRISIGRANAQRQVGIGL